MEESNPALKLSFLFKFFDGKKEQINIRIDENTLNLIPSNLNSPPDWARLENFECPNCPIDRIKHKFCPLAINLSDVIPNFTDSRSFEEVEVTIKTDARTYYKKTSLQNALGSLFGIVMVASDCPIMGKLKPMMRFHLPFATLEETDYRVLSMYMLAQYVIARKGGEPDWQMNNLKNLYEDIKILNLNLSRKLSKIQSKDAIVNAVVILNSFAEHVTFLLSKNMLKRLEILFKDYL